VNLEEKLQQLKRASKKTTQEAALERELLRLQRLHPIPEQLPAKRVPDGVETCVDGRVELRDGNEIFVAEQTLPFGRPYGKFRIGDVTASVLSPLDLFLEGATLPDPSRLVFLDTETTGLVGDPDVCAFLIGLGAAEGAGFRVQQFFLRNREEEKAALEAVAEALERREGLVTFNGRTFDVPLLEMRYALLGLPTPFSRLIHLDVLHPARRLWKLRLEGCHLTHLERVVLGIAREGDVPGSEIPGIYFDYLRTGDAHELQGVFFHNALDIISLAALTVELARLIGDAARDSPSLASCAGPDLFSLSRIFARSGCSEVSVSMARRAVAVGLPEAIEAQALWHLSMQHKKRGEFDLAANLWLELTRRDIRSALAAFRELAVHYERRMRDSQKALEFTDSALEFLKTCPVSPAEGRTIPIHLENFTRRRCRLQKRIERRGTAIHR
jgi:uncharacterized protein YprB with RNaseH-like and TPR domain